MIKIGLAVLLLAVAACSTHSASGSAHAPLTNAASAARSTPSMSTASPSPLPSPDAKTAEQVAIDGATRQSGATFVVGSPNGIGCPGALTRCFVIQSQVAGVKAIYFRAWLKTSNSGSLCLIYTVQDAGGWRYLDMTCSAPESGGPEGPDVGNNDVVENAGGTCANVRQAPGLGSKVIGCLRTGTDVTVDGGPVYVIEKSPTQSHLWWHLSGKGWMAHDYLFVVWIQP